MWVLRSAEAARLHFWGISQMSPPAAREALAAARSLWFLGKPPDGDHQWCASLPPICCQCMAGALGQQTAGRCGLLDSRGGVHAGLRRYMMQPVYRQFPEVKARHHVLLDPDQAQDFDLLSGEEWLGTPRLSPSTGWYGAKPWSPSLTVSIYHMKSGI